VIPRTYIAGQRVHYTPARITRPVNDNRAVAQIARAFHDLFPATTS